MNSNGHFEERDITINVSVDTIRSNSIAALLQFLRSVKELKNSDEVLDVTDFNWAGLASPKEAVMPVRLKIKSKTNGKPDKEVYVKQLNG